MKRTTMILAALAAAPLVALAQGATKDAAKTDAPPKADAARAPAKAGPIAKVNGVAVPKARLDMMVLQQMGRGAPDNEQTRALIREELVNREIIAQEAAKAGIPKVPEVQTQLDLTRQEIIVGAYIRDWVRKHPITEPEIEKEYERIKTIAPQSEYKARHILVDTEAQAKDLIGQLKKGAKFDELASKNSKDSGTKDRGGDLDWNAPGVFDKQFSDAMVKLEKGKYTEAPVQTRFGYHVIQLDDVRAVKVPPLAELKPRIQQQLAQQRVEDLVRGLRAKAKVE
jgi:peptidyl-prolyl cis-trans isomerase C